MNAKTKKYFKVFLQFFVLISTFQLFSQAVANQPTNYMVCDTLNNGVENILLTIKDNEILGDQSTTDFSVKYYLSNSDAQNSVNVLANIYSASNNQTLFARVEENINTSNFDITSFQIILSQMVLPVFDPIQDVCQGTSMTLPPTSNNGIVGYWSSSIINFDTPPGNYILTFVPNSGQCAETVNININVIPKPIANYGPSIIMNDMPYDGIATFNLAQNENIIVGGQTGVIITYYPSLSDAVFNSNSISNFNSYNNTSNPQTIGVRVMSPISGCYSVATFNISVTNPNPNIINFTDSVFKSKLLAANSSSPIAYSNGNMVKIDLNDDFEIEYSEAAVIDSLNINNSIGGALSEYILDLNGIEGFTNLKKIKCSTNKISIFNLNSNTFLEDIDISGNLLTEINTVGLPNLKILNCFSNQLSSLLVSSSILLEVLNCGSNSLTELNCNGLSNLITLFCNDNNQLTYLDLNQNSNLEYFNSTYCTNLESVFLKNGANETYEFAECPSLTFICADENQVLNIQNDISALGYTNCTVNSYCSFTPGGSYNTINGTVVYDNENDDCDINDEPFDFLRINITDGTNTGSTFTNFEGDYNFYTNEGTFTVTPQLENPTYFNVSPPTTLISFVNTNNNLANQNFCITPNGVHNDLEIVLTQTTPARPGFDAEYALVYKNKGNQTLSGTVLLTFEGDKLDFVSANLTPSSQQTNALSWDYSNLQPFENRSITITLNVNSPMEIPAVNNGDVLVFNTSITPVVGDEVPADNTFAFNQIVVGSYDPNDIYCLEGTTVDPSQIGNYLHYTIRFENTGTAAAENVIVATIIDGNDFDLSTLQVLNASHNVYTRMNGNSVEFIFENIQLAGSPSGGHGHVLMKIKSKNTLQTNDTVKNNANIFFDYNFPIETNDAETTFATLNSTNFTKDETIKIYPNPTNSIVNVNSDNTIKSVQLYDVQGRLLQTVLINSNVYQFDISERTKGIYFVKIATDNGVTIEKIVKE